MDAKDIAEELQDTNVVEQPVEEVQQEAPPEKMLSVSQVNELVKKAKLKGEKKMQAELDAARQELEQLKAQQAQQAQQQPPVQPPQAQGQNIGMGGMPQVNPEQLASQVMERLRAEMQEKEQQRQQAEIEKQMEAVAQQYFGKMAQGKELFHDFDAITADFAPDAFPELVFLANEVDNTPAIIYELSKNPSKIATLQQLVEKSPQMARREIMKLSQSIKTNEEAQRNEQSTQEPLNRLKPSTVGTDNGTRTVRDFKNASFLKV